MEWLIEVTLRSASNLKDVSSTSRMETFAVLKFEPYLDYTTQVDFNNGVNPSWNEKLAFTIPEHVIRRADHHLKVGIFTLSSLGPIFVCEASIPLLDIAGFHGRNETLQRTYPLRTNSGENQGDLTVSFLLKERVTLKSRSEELQSRFIEATSLSARNLKNDIENLSKLKTYAELKFAPYVYCRTAVDDNNDVNPSWNDTLVFGIPDRVFRRGRGCLKVVISTLTTLGPTPVCEALIPLIDIALLPRRSSKPVAKEYQLKSKTGEYCGELTISFTIKPIATTQASQDEGPSTKKKLTMINKLIVGPLGLSTISKLVGGPFQ